MGTQTADDHGGKNTMRPKATGQQKKPYRPPRIAVYGNLRRLTQGGTGAKGDGGAPKSKA